MTTVPVALNPRSNVGDLLVDERRRIDRRRGVAEDRRLAEDRRAGRRDGRVRQPVLECRVERRSTAVLSAASTSACVTFGNSSWVPPVVASGLTTLRAWGSSPLGTITIVFGSTLPAIPASTAVTPTVIRPGKTVRPTRSARGTVTVALVRNRTPALVLTMLPPGTMLVRRKSQVREADLAGRLGLLDPLPGRRERVGDRDLERDPRRPARRETWRPARSPRGRRSTVRSSGGIGSGRGVTTIVADGSSTYAPTPPTSTIEAEHRERHDERQPRRPPPAGPRPAAAGWAVRPSRADPAGRSNPRPPASAIRSAIRAAARDRVADRRPARRRRARARDRRPGCPRPLAWSGLRLGPASAPTSVRRRSARRRGGPSSPARPRGPRATTRTPRPTRRPAARPTPPAPASPGPPATIDSRFSLLSASRDRSRKLIRDVATREPYGRTRATRRASLERIRAAADVISSSTSR